MKYLNAPRLSLIIGAHQFLLHPLLLLLAWWRLYGPPRDPRLLAAFFVHDWGYWSCTDLEGESGRTHPEGGARLMTRLFGAEWGQWTRLHSRSYAKMLGWPPSRLCAADKLACALEWPPFYLLRVRLSGELREYRASFPAPGTDLEWARQVQADCRGWAYANAPLCIPPPARPVPSPD